MSRIEEKIDDFNVLADKAIVICSLVNCDSQKFQLEDLITKINQEINNIYELLGTRNKRSWYGKIQHAIKIINGIVNPEDARQYEQLITDKVYNINVNLDSLKGKLQIIESELNLVKFNDAVTKTINYLFARIDEYVVVHTNLTNRTEELKYRTKINYVLIYGLEIYQEVQSITTTIMFAKRGELHPRVLTPKQILSELIIATKHIPLNLHFPYALLEQNSERILQLSELTSFRINKLLIFSISNPLTSDEIFDVFKLIPFPMKVSLNKFIFINTKNNYLLFNEKRTNFALMEDMSTCLSVHPELFICNLLQPIYSRISNKICEVELLTKIENIPQDCDMKVVTLNHEIWEKVHYFNNWIFVAPKPNDLVIECPTYSKEITIQNSGILSLEAECSARTSDVNLYSTKVQFNEQHFSLAPKFDLKLLIRNYSEKIQSIDTIDIINPITNFGNLKSLGVSLKTSHRENGYNLIIVISSSFLLITLASSMYAVFKNKICRKPQLVEPNPEEILDLEQGLNNIMHNAH